MILGECRCLHANWGAYNVMLAEALRAIEKLVPAVALDRGTPVGEWCECRPVVRAAAEAAERRAKQGRGRGRRELDGRADDAGRAAASMQGGGGDGRAGAEEA